MTQFQHVRLSVHHPPVHLASTAITEENKTDSRATLCGAGLGSGSLLGLSEPTTCERCLKILHRRQRDAEWRTP